MKKFLILILLFVSATTYAQTPKRYYLAGSGGGTGGATDTALVNQLISDSLATVIDSLRKSNDSVYARIGGQFVFQYIDSGGVGTNTNFANANLTATANRLHDWNDFTFEMNNWKSLIFLSKTGTASQYSFLELDTTKFELKAENPTTTKISQLLGNNTQAKYTFSNTATSIESGFYSVADSTYLEYKNSSNTYRSIIGEDKFLYRKATIAGSMLREVVAPTWGSGLDTLATLANVRSGGGGSVDTTSLSNRINLKLNISDTAAMLAPYLESIDTASLSNRINQKLNISDTTVFQRKSTAAYSFKANLTGSTADATDTPIRTVKGATFAGTITWTNTGSAPSGDSTIRYNWTQIDGLVTLTLRAYYTNAGSNVSAVTFSWPSGVPEPYDAVNLANAVLYPASGYITTNYTTEPAAMHRFYIRRNASNTAFEVHGISPNVSARYAVVTVTYTAAN